MEEKPIGFLLKKIRLEKGISQRQLSKNIGMDRGSISQIENGKTSSMTIRIFLKWASGLNMTPSDLLDMVTLDAEISDNNELRSFIFNDYPNLGEEDKDWIRRTITMVRERKAERDKYNTE